VSAGTENRASDAAPATMERLARKPRVSIFIATAAGLGYLPKAPGTWGSLAGLLLPFLPMSLILAIFVPPHDLWNLYFGDQRYVSFVWDNSAPTGSIDPLLVIQWALALLTGAIGVWSASRASRFWNVKDPQCVVIDEVSGQHLTLLLGFAVPIWWRPSDIPLTGFPFGLITVRSVLNWKYLLLGFILFRLFDIWKPFPARQAESLPGGWGIMADDWMAGIYAAIGLWIARAAGL
jgi:phosphatidylglycerophosphatase A